MLSSNFSTANIFVNFNFIYLVYSCFTKYALKCLFDKYIYSGEIYRIQNTEQFIRHHRANVFFAHTTVIRKKKKIKIYKKHNLMKKKMKTNMLRKYFLVNVFL